MPKGVPANIATSFGAWSHVHSGDFFWIARVVLGFDLTQFLNIIISPLLVLQDTWFGVLVCVILLQLLWFVGIHEILYCMGVCYPLLITNIAENTAASLIGQPFASCIYRALCVHLDHDRRRGQYTAPVPDLVSLSPRPEEVAHLALPCGIFIINEPIIFGAPIAFNPIMFVPFMLSGIVDPCFCVFPHKAGDDHGSLCADTVDHASFDQSIPVIRRRCGVWLPRWCC